MKNASRLVSSLFWLWIGVISCSLVSADVLEVYSMVFVKARVRYRLQQLHHFLSQNASSLLYTKKYGKLCKSLLRSRVGCRGVSMIIFFLKQIPSTVAVFCINVFWIEATHLSVSEARRLRYCEWHLSVSLTIGLGGELRHDRLLGENVISCSRSVWAVET